MHIYMQITTTGTVYFYVSFKSQANSHEYLLTGDHTTVGVL